MFRTHQQMKMPLSWMSRIFPWLFGFAFLSIISVWIVIGVVMYKSASTVSEVGVKGAMQSLWCGNQANCKLPDLLD